MYSVMLADDDYPVIELLSETIEWERLGFRLIGAHENGLSAWEQAEREMPDVLITDIGMPRMDGLELAARMRSRKAGVRIVILSCHSEFQLAQQAMRLNVQEYFLKDALDPDELTALLKKLKDGLDEEKHMSWEQSRLQLLVNETRELRIEKTIKNFIQQPLLSPEKWREEVSGFGLLLCGEECLPVIGFIDNYRHVHYRFASDQTLRFAVGNVMDEVLGGITLPRGLHVGYGAKRSLLLFSYKPSLKVNMIDSIKAVLRQIQDTLQRVLKIQMSFLIGSGGMAPESLKQSLSELLASEEQRFYLSEGECAKRVAPVTRTEENLFDYYDEANQQLRAALMGKREQETRAAAEYWMSFIRRRQYPSELVKDWVLKLLLDLRLKLHAFQQFRSSHTADTLHKEAAELDSLAQLADWLFEHLQAAAAAAKTKGAPAGRRSEIGEACGYVALHIGRRISLDEVAEHLHLNASYFSRLFKKELGMTFIEYVTRMKMERAKELLDGTPHTVGEICELLGYDNQSYFIKTFKAHAGATPVEYRR